MQDKPTAETVADSLIDEIREGVIADGAVLPAERELCERFSTSRPTIRAALMRMQSRGFASRETARRPRAKRPSIASVFDAAGESIRELFGGPESNAYLDQVRQFIEVGAVRTAAQDASNIQIAQIHAALQAGYEALCDDLAFARADADFHRAIVSVVQNPIILELHDRFVFQLVASRPVEPDQLEKNEQSYEEHRRIYEAIVDNDVDAAMTIMDRHLARSYKARLTPPKKLQARSEV